jgi:hypothetical protein
VTYSRGLIGVSAQPHAEEDPGGGLRYLPTKKRNVIAKTRLFQKWHPAVIANVSGGPFLLM